MKTIIALLSVFITATSAAYAASASENWENSCASCHGADGKAQTKQGKKLKIRDYTDPAVQAVLKDDAMIKATAEGVMEAGKQRMKGFKDEYSEAEIKDLVAFVRALKP